MDRVFNVAKGFVAAVGGSIAFWLGGLDKLLTALLVLMVIDYITGLTCASFDRTLSSKVGFKGIVKKILLLGVIAVAFVIEHVTGGQLPLREITIMFFVANEGISILENAAKLGVPLPEKLKNALIQLKGEKSNG